LPTATHVHNSEKQASTRVPNRPEANQTNLIYVDQMV